MKWAVLLTVFVACGSSAPDPKSGDPVVSEPAPPTALNKRTDINVSAFQEIHAAGNITLLDVRTPEEYKQGHIPGAINLPVDQVHTEHPMIASFDKAEPLYFVCAVGGRSAKAADRMASAGFRTVSVDGGTNGWVEQGLPVEQ